jgi:hypothetical protein
MKAQLESIISPSNSSSGFTSGVICQAIEGEDDFLKMCCCDSFPVVPSVRHSIAGNFGPIFPNTQKNIVKLGQQDFSLGYLVTRRIPP